jgi:hypothetical protein
MTLLEGTRAWYLCVYDLNHKLTIHAIDLTPIVVVYFPKAIFLSFSIYRPFCVLSCFLISADGLLKFLYPSVRPTEHRLQREKYWMLLHKL